jgi:hypothetical protein
MVFVAPSNTCANFLLFVPLKIKNNVQHHNTEPISVMMVRFWLFLTFAGQFLSEKINTLLLGTFCYSTLELHILEPSFFRNLEITLLRRLLTDPNFAKSQENME